MSSNKPEGTPAENDRHSAGNPAQILAQLIAKWAVPPNTHPEVVRGLEEEGGAGELDFWRNQARALGLAREIDHVLAGMDSAGIDVSMYLSLVPRVYAALFSYPAPWGRATNDHRVLMSATELDHLRGLGALMNAHGELRVAPTEQRTLRDALDEAESLVLNDSQMLDQAARQYVWRLIVEALNTLDEIDHFGSIPVRNAAFQLAGALSENARVLDAAQQPEQASAWKNVRDKVTGAVGAEAAREGVRALGRLAKQAIESAGN